MVNELVLRRLELFGKAMEYCVEKSAVRYDPLDDATTETLLEMRRQAELRIAHKGQPDAGQG